MKLSELVTGQEAIIRDVYGNSAIKRRMNEMGFVKGRKVKAIKSAPFKDPVEYDLMGYNITIRKKDAEAIHIERVPEPVADQRIHGYENWTRSVDAPLKPENRQSNNSKTIEVALVGNPNCGKTTIFNFATNSRERVANYSGVTVAAKEARFEIGEFTLNVIDLPGTYSLSSYSPEEMFVTDYLTRENPDLIINVIDAGNIERNLYLTTQLIDTGIPMVIALNMYDELKSGKGRVDYKKLSQLLGMPVIPTVGTKGKGLNELFQTVIRVYTYQQETRPIQIPYGKEIEDAVLLIQQHLGEKFTLSDQKKRLCALKILEGDQLFLKDFSNGDVAELKEIATFQRSEIEVICGTDIHSELVNLRYGFIQGALSETYTRGNNEKLRVSQKIDQVLTHKYLGLPVFFGIVWFLFFSTFKLGEYPMNLIDRFVGFSGGIIASVLPEGIFTSLLVDGIVGGVGGVIVFLPNIMILFFLISVLEDTGYMARTAFLMDKTMHKAGLHGKSFIPLLMGFGCNVPAVMATRTIESKRDRMITMFIIPFMSCSARLPVYVLFISAFFPHFESVILFLMYTIGILAALLTAIILNKTIFKRVESPFVMELPPYRFPTLKAVSKHTWFKTTHFLKKMGTVILFASIVIWALGYFPRDKQIISTYNAKIQDQQILSESIYDADNEINTSIQELENQKQRELLEQSYISRLGKFIEPVFAPLGFDWRMSVSILTGVMAKEVVVSSMGILYQAGNNADETNVTLVSKLRESQTTSQVPLIAYFGFLVFTLLYFPCLGTLIAINKETSNFKWVLFSASYPIAFAWIVTFIIYQTGLLL